MSPNKAAQSPPPSDSPGPQYSEALATRYQAIKLHVDALTSAAGRCRKTLVVLAVASVLFFVAYWNSRDDSWLNLRIRMAQQCLYEQSYELGMPTPTSQEEISRFLAQRTFLDALGLFQPGITDPQRRELLEREVGELRRLKKENVLLVHVPFFQVVFDVNDLGMLAGITFLLVLLAYWFSVTRERDTLKHAFTAGDDIFYGLPGGGRRHIYNTLSTSQVLNVPEQVDSQNRRALDPRLIKKYVTKLLVVPPSLIQGAILLNDHATIRYGSTLGEHKTSIAIMTEGVLLVLVLIVSFACTYVSVDITKIWDTKFKEIELAEAKEKDANAKKKADEEQKKKEEEEKKKEEE